MARTPRGDVGSRVSWGNVAAIAGLALAVVLFVMVFLVLTGIIAEPETVIESIVRGVLGK